jgi:hypothetical protein
VPKAEKCPGEQSPEAAPAASSGPASSSAVSVSSLSSARIKEEVVDGSEADESPDVDQDGLSNGATKKVFV